ncbi:MAG: DUF6440 family protein [Moorellales bacterium]
MMPGGQFNRSGQPACGAPGSGRFAVVCTEMPVLGLVVQVLADRGTGAEYLLCRTDATMALCVLAGSRGKAGHE